MKSGSDGEISFYDELGVEQSATADGIRETYRSLVRLLHPDQQTDPQLKSVAEAQMRKLNRIYAVLSDPEKRAKYDALLQGAAEPPTLVLSDETAALARRWGRRIGLGLLAGAVVAGIIYSMNGSGRDADDPAVSLNKRSIAKATGSTASDQTDELQQLRSEVHALETERNRALEELARLRGGMAPPAARPDRAEPTRSPQPPASSVVTSLPRSNFGGVWYWTRSMQPSSELRGSYQPESIDVTLTENNGVIRGSYRAKYKVPDSSINPDVNFEFAATLAGPILICPWTGPEGARGEVMVRQTSANSLQVDWTANELGARQRVSTGSAVLARKYSN
jgi:curved DNA-binding protein CbpA